MGPAAGRSRSPRGQASSPVNPLVSAEGRQRQVNQRGAVNASVCSWESLAARGIEAKRGRRRAGRTDSLNGAEREVKPAAACTSHYRVERARAFPGPGSQVPPLAERGYALHEQGRPECPLAVVADHGVRCAACCPAHPRVTAEGPGSATRRGNGLVGDPFPALGLPAWRCNQGPHRTAESADSATGSRSRSGVSSVRSA